MSKKYDSLNVQYSITNDTVDDRLIPIDILVMHDGVNYNSSSFSKEVMENAKESLKNIPILAYIKENDQGDKDFDGHNLEINLKENKDGELEFKVKYLERPIGVVPETNDYHYEERDGKTYVGCKGYLWKEYLNDGLEILEANPSKSVSMEIVVNDGNWNDEISAYEITDYKYLGITVLGDDVAPAMQGSKMEVANFSINNKDFFAKVEQLNKELKQSLFEGGEGVEDKKFEEAVETTEESTEEFTETVEESTENVEETTVNTSEETEDTTEEFNEGATEQKSEEKFTKIFELSHDDIRSKLYSLLYEIEEEDDDWYWINEVFDDYFIYSGYKKIYKQGYIKTDVDVAFEGERVEMFIEYLTAVELEELNNMRNNYSLILSENEELKSFKSDILAQQKTNEVEDVFSKYSTLLDVADFEDLKENATNMEIAELEKELSFRLVQKKFDFSKITKKDSTKITIKENKDSNEPYGSASVYFNK